MGEGKVLFRIDSWEGESRVLGKELRETEVKSKFILVPKSFEIYM